MRFCHPHLLPRLLTPALLAWLLCGCGASVQPVVTLPASTPANPPAAVRSGPQLGYIWSDQAHTLRPVLGVPGSTQLGQSVVPEGLYATGAASNLSGLAMLQENDGSLDLMSLPDGQPARLAASAAPGASLRFAPSGLAAIAFLPGQSTVTLFTNLLAAPKTATITFPQPLTDAAVSDSGSIAAALPLAGSIVIRIGNSSMATTNLAANLTTLGGMAFAGTADSLLLADASANTLMLVNKASSSAPSPTLLPPALLPTADLLNSPLGLAASRDGRWATLANTGDASVVRIDLSGQAAPQRFACDCKPSLVAPLSGAGVFRITGADSGPIWIFDAAALTPRTLFIPARASATATKAGSN